VLWGLRAGGSFTWATRSGGVFASTRWSIAPPHSLPVRADPTSKPSKASTFANRYRSSSVTVKGRTPLLKGPTLPMIWLVAVDAMNT
jgi:hypothetical protein